MRKDEFPIVDKLVQNSINEVLEKIKAEIEDIRAEIENDLQLKKYPISPFSCGFRRAIEVIDKYIAEIEKGD